MTALRLSFAAPPFQPTGGLNLMRAFRNSAPTMPDADRDAFLLAHKIAYAAARRAGLTPEDADETATDFALASVPGVAPSARGTLDAVEMLPFSSHDLTLYHIMRGMTGLRYSS